MALGSLFSSLFQKKRPEPASAATVSSAPPASGEAGEARVRRRLAVDQAVTVALSAAGVQPSGYKHDAKRMDPNGQRFLVTIDLNRDMSEVSAGKLSQVGAAIIQYAKSKGETEVISVYWRVEPGAMPLGPVSLLSQGRTMQAEAATDLKSSVAAGPAEVAAPAKAAASEKIAKLRALMKDDGPATRTDNADPAYLKTQVIPAFQKTQVMRAVDDTDRGKSDKP